MNKWLTDYCCEYEDSDEITDDRKHMSATQTQRNSVMSGMLEQNHSLGY